MLISTEKMAKLLNRSLTQAETDNFDLYLGIATERLEELLCTTLCGDDSSRTFQTRKGYKTLYLDPFTDIESVTVDGELIDESEYTKKQNDLYNGSWYNSIEFDDKMTGKLVVVDADWGFECLPYDLQLLLAKIFNQVGVDQRSDGQVKSKKIEDFTVTYKDSGTYDQLVIDNASLINKYSLCNVGRVESNYVRAFCDDRLYIS